MFFDFDLLWRKPWLGQVFVLVLAAIAYVNSFPAAFLLDDFDIVLNNPLVAAPNLHAIFTTDYWGAVSNSGLYRPVTILSLALNRALLGPTATGFHLVNLLLHSGIAVLLLAVLRKWGLPPCAAWLAAALFAVHPLHAEVVNTAVGRSELLVAFFLLLALLWSDRTSLSYRLGFYGSFVLALLSKEHAVVFLAILPCVDWFWARTPRKLQARWPVYAGLLLVTAGWVGLRLWGVERIAPPQPPDPYFVPLTFVPLADRLVSALALQWQYLIKLFIPWPLHTIYAHANTSHFVVHPFTLLGAAVVVATAALFVWLFVGWRSGRVPALLGVLYVISFVPTANIIFPTGVTFAERLAYLPSLWFCAAVAAAMIRGRVPDSSESRSGLAVGALVLLVFLLLTLWRNPDFSSGVRLWRAATVASPDNVLAWLYLGSAYSDAGDLTDAEEAYRTMIETAPDFPDGLRTYAGFLVENGRPAEAIPLALRATSAKQGGSPFAFMILAEAYYQVGNYRRAHEVLGTMGESYTHHWYYWVLSGKVNEALGRDQEAIDAYRRSQPWPEGTELPERLGLLLLRNGRYAEAEFELRRAVATGRSAAAWNGLGIALALQNRKAEARNAFQQAVAIEPENGQYLENLGKVE